MKPHTHTQSHQSVLFIFIIFIESFFFIIKLRINPNFFFKIDTVHIINHKKKLEIKSYPKSNRKPLSRMARNGYLCRRKVVPQIKIFHTQFTNFITKKDTPYNTHTTTTTSTHICVVQKCILCQHGIDFFFFFTTTTDHCKSVCLIARGQNRRYTRNYKRVDNKIIGVFKMLFWKLCTKKMLEENLLSARLIIVIILCVCDMCGWTQDSREIEKKNLFRMNELIRKICVPHSTTSYVDMIFLTFQWLMVKHRIDETAAFFSIERLKWKQQ